MISLLTILVNVSDVSAATTFNKNSVSSSAVTVKNYVETNHKAPSTVTVASNKVTSAQYLYILTSTVKNVYQGKTTSAALRSVSYPSSSTDTVKSGTLTKTEYISIASRVNTFVSTYGRLPNYVTTSQGKMRYENLIYTYSKIMAFYKTNNRLPNTVSVKSWSSITTTSEGTTSNVQSILNSIGYAEAKYKDIQGQSSASVMEKVGYGDCWADAEWLYNKLNAAGISARIMGYVGGGTGSWYRHAWVQYNIGNGYVNWAYTKYSSQHYGDGLGAAAYVLIAASSRIVDVAAMVATGY